MPSLCCSDFLDARWSRRTALRIGALGGLLSQTDLLRAEASQTTSKATAKSVILLFQFGGPSHLDTFDPKPGAPAEIRGEFASVPSSATTLMFARPIIPGLPPEAARRATTRVSYADITAATLPSSKRAIPFISALGTEYCATSRSVMPRSPKLGSKMPLDVSRATKPYIGASGSLECGPA